ncbi:hypothetical protein FAS33_25165 [Salmonella enterica subsp. enterica serovar Newport]|nr:hypothetical protein [Salmonella enterica subsp. enterica serovar Teko]ECD7340236.1 hypothetical protein [Salmonella enterica subsp. enterica serovar Newport]
MHESGFMGVCLTAIGGVRVIKQVKKGAETVTFWRETALIISLQNSSAEVGMTKILFSSLMVTSQCYFAFKCIKYKKEEANC